VVVFDVLDGLGATLVGAGVGGSFGSAPAEDSAPLA
jgi:hypothetical protein